MAKPKRKHHRRRRNPSSVGDFMHEHPWMTFFIVTGAISGIVTIIRGREPPIVIGPTVTPAALKGGSAPATVADAEAIVRQLYG